jgi:hypothetical protein
MIAMLTQIRLSSNTDDSDADSSLSLFREAKKNLEEYRELPTKSAGGIQGRTLYKFNF